jgi:hypothetical protein
MPALFVGGIAAAAGHRWGAHVLIANIALQHASHLAVGTWAYREVMSRPWPEVPALGDREWDD